MVVGLDTEDLSAHNLISQNSIYENGSLDIDLADDGITPNDDAKLDRDKGPNNLQNYANFTDAITTSKGTTISVEFVTTPTTKVRIEYFLSDGCGSLRWGEGQTYVGTTFYTTDNKGNGVGLITVPERGDGKFATTTITSPYNNTSEFSECATVRREHG